MGDLTWSELAYDLGLQGLAREIVLNSLVVSFQSDYLRLQLSPELKEIISPSIEQEIHQAIEKRFNRSCRLEFMAQSQLAGETPYEIKVRQQEAQRQAMITTIKKSEVVTRLNHTFGLSLVENSVRKADD